MSTSRGKVFRVGIKVHNEDLLRLVKHNREFRAGVLHDIGRRARKLLQKAFLSKKSSMSSVKAKGFARGKVGYKVSNRMGKRLNKIVITSPILNFFEFGRTYTGVGRPGKPNPKTGKESIYARKSGHDPARLILTEKFRNLVSSRLQGYGEWAIMNTLRKMIK